MIIHVSSLMTEWNLIRIEKNGEEQFVVPITKEFRVPSKAGGALVKVAAKPVRSTTGSGARSSSKRLSAPGVTVNKTDSTDGGTLAKVLELLDSTARTTTGKRQEQLRKVVAELRDEESKCRALHARLEEARTRVIRGKELIGELRRSYLERAMDTQGTQDRLAQLRNKHDDIDHRARTVEAERRASDFQLTQFERSNEFSDEKLEFLATYYRTRKASFKITFIDPAVGNRVFCVVRSKVKLKDMRGKTRNRFRANAYMRLTRDAREEEKFLLQLDCENSFVCRSDSSLEVELMDFLLRQLSQKGTPDRRDKRRARSTEFLGGAMGMNPARRYSFRDPRHRPLLDGMLRVESPFDSSDSDSNMPLANRTNGAPQPSPQSSPVPLNLTVSPASPSQAASEKATPQGRMDFSTAWETFFEGKDMSSALSAEVRASESGEETMSSLEHSRFVEEETPDMDRMRPKRQHQEPSALQRARAAGSPPSRGGKLPIGHHGSSSPEIRTSSPSPPTAPKPQPASDPQKRVDSPGPRPKQKPQRSRKKTPSPVSTGGEEPTGPPGTFSGLPRSCKKHVFSFIHLRDAYHTSLVCREWSRLLWKGIKQADLSLAMGLNMVDGALERLRSTSPQLEVLIIRHLHIGEAGLRILPRFTHLRVIHVIYSSQLVETIAGAVSRCSKIREVVIRGPGIINNVLRKMTLLTNLESLELENCPEVTDEGVALLKALPSLRRLKLVNCEKVTDRGLRDLGSFPSLQSLDLGWCRRVSHAGLTFLSDIRAVHVVPCMGSDLKIPAL
eukprot:TRINITY_DN17784_c0_g1_i1.p1 TRINITY_DN17784_c0_g1~~TRINITY_DN17784_c0_g1_i1.p1  ORF type:complete len:853 (+),score=153.53 TRINITY_DN17784_c0_g1_i1:200-2560(+)